MGAMEDSRAPYNQRYIIPSKFDEKEAKDAIIDEITDCEDIFVEWLADNYPIDGMSMTFEADVQELAKEESVREAYFDYRHEEVLNNIIQKYYE